MPESFRSGDRVYAYLHRQVRWFFAFEDAIDVARRRPVLLDAIRPVRGEPAGRDEGTIRKDRGQSVLGCKADNQVAMKHGRRARKHDLTAIRLARESSDGALHLADIARVNQVQLHPQRGRHGLDSAQQVVFAGHRGSRHVGDVQSSRSRKAGCASTSVVGCGFRSGKLRTSKCFPICPRKRTSSDTTSMSALCHKRP